MGIEELKVTNKNIMDILTDDNVYVIRRTFCGEYRMNPISESDVKTVLSEEVKIVRITND